MLEIAFDSFKENGIVVSMCCCCGSEDISTEHEVKIAMSMCDACINKKEREKVEPKTSDK